MKCYSRRGTPAGPARFVRPNARAVLQVTVAGVELAHLLYQVALAYSGWCYVEIVLGG
jgi:hypothetical protein